MSIEIEMLINNKAEKTFGVISPTEIQVGDQFDASTLYNPNYIITIKEILEQRKSKGTFKDEAQRPFWAKVS